MSKGQDAKKESKRKPALSAAEKKQKKKDKKQKPDLFGNL